MSVKNGRLIKAIVPTLVGQDLDRLQVHLGLSTLSNVVAFAIRRLALAELSGHQAQNQATSLNDEREVA